jgi:hypothetical protein
MRYMLAIIGEEGGWEDVTPEQMKEAMSRWADFDEKVIGDGVWVAGDGLQPSATATTVKIGEGEATVTDGPFAETKEQLGGFYLLDCESLDEALDYAKQIPAQPGNSIEVRPVMDYGNFGYTHPLDREKAASS